MRSLYFFFLLVAGLFLPHFGCSVASIVEQIAVPSDLSVKILPIRTLRVLVVTDNSHDLAEITKSVGEASGVLKKQIGIELHILPSPILVNWKEERITFEELQKISSEREGEFDIAIGFGRQLPEQVPAYTEAMNESIYRRFIISMSTHPWLLAHEVGHSFIFCHVHSVSGLMQAYGSVFMGANEYTFAKEDREEALRNKWRKFEERVELANPDGPVPDQCR